MRKIITISILLSSIVVSIWIFYKKVYIPHHTYYITKPKIGDINKTLFGIGQVEPTQTYKITPQEGGKIIKLFAKVGDKIHKNQTLAKIDPVDLPSKIESAKLEIIRQELLLRANQEDLKAQEARELWAKREYQRLKDLHKSDASSQEAFEHALSDYNASQAQSNSLRLKIKATQKSIDIAKANLAGLNEHLKRITISSPADGIITSQKASSGQTLLANQTIFELVNPNDLRVFARIDERLCDAIRVGQSVYITLRSWSKKSLKGVVSRINPQADPVTLEKEIEISFKTLPPNWSLHEEARVWINIKSFHNKLILPAKALIYHKNRVGVWSLNNNKAKFTPIHIIARQGQKVAIKGVSIKDSIILPTPNTLKLIQNRSILGYIQK